ncbi:MAG: aminodeoxychorismate/anthranilate synthase component II [Rhodothermales bacterium]|nr:aminodeoxychorismate/anthranilate synthase component II [Rhodothermales bacterium]
MILIIDNYDSFTYNLVHLVSRDASGEEHDVRVVRNDDLTPDDIGELDPRGILISPGPGRPADAGITNEVIRTFSGRIPILGVCLGHQAIGEVFGGRITYAPSLMHGKTSRVTHESDPLFTGVSSPFIATRYHSLVIDPESLPDSLRVIARTEDDVIMGVRHREHPVCGIQFHPESLLTTEGPTMVRNWLASL